MRTKLLACPVLQREAHDVAAVCERLPIIDVHFGEPQLTVKQQQEQEQVGARVRRVLCGCYMRSCCQPVRQSRQLLAQSEQAGSSSSNGRQP